MNATKTLFHHKSVYDISGTDELFLRAVRENAQWHYDNCLQYRGLMSAVKFSPAQLESYEDLQLLPPIPTLYLKQHRLLSIPDDKLRLKSTTSGTSGQPVEVGFDTGAMFLGFSMLRRMLVYHGLLSIKPANYLILGYQPSKRNRMGAVRTAHVATFLAPAKHREYALRDTGEDYALNIEGVLKALISYSKSNTPVRIIGFPAYFFFLLKKLEQEGVALKLPESSFVFLGGGWKQFASQSVSKDELYALSKERLGLARGDIKEFFGVVEHNVPYFSCENHHFHVPIYSRVIIRDFRTMQPVEYGKPGLLNLITPLLKSMPFTSIMTDDIAILRPGSECGCGNPAPYFEVLGRAGMQGIKTCAAGAAGVLEGML